MGPLGGWVTTPEPAICPGDPTITQSGGWCHHGTRAGLFLAPPEFLLNLGGFGGIKVVSQELGSSWGSSLENVTSSLENATPGWCHCPSHAQGMASVSPLVAAFRSFIFIMGGGISPPPVTLQGWRRP